MKLTKATGGCIVAGYEWEHDGDTIEVPTELALELLAIKGHDFSVPDDQGEISEVDPDAELSESPPRGKGGQFKAAVQEKDGTDGRSGR